MCGICGKLYFDPDRVAERQVPERLNAVLAHRSPNDDGVCWDGSGGLLYRRLSIDHSSPANQQPLSRGDDAIHDSKSLRPNLVALGHRFLTLVGDADEVLLG